MITKICQECGIEYQTRNSQASRSKYCSLRCLGAHNGRNRYREDLSGKRYGRLLVLRQDGRIHGAIAYICLCDCGKEIRTMSQSLRNGDTKSCGCWGREISALATSKARKKPIQPGMKFNRWTVEYEVGKNKRGSYIYSCVCECGKRKVVIGSCLRNGASKSCGCLKKEKFIQRSTTHGQTGTKEYNRWRASVRKEKDKQWTQKMDNALRKLQPSCIICDSTKDLAVDHVNPASKGYGLKPGNAVILCKSCNSSKNDKDLSELPIEWQEMITSAAQQFLDYWNSLSEN